MADPLPPAPSSTETTPPGPLSVSFPCCKVALQVRFDKSYLTCREAMHSTLVKNLEQEGCKIHEELRRLTLRTTMYTGKEKQERENELKGFLDSLPFFLCYEAETIETDSSEGEADVLNIAGTTWIRTQDDYDKFLSQGCEKKLSYREQISSVHALKAENQELRKALSFYMKNTEGIGWKQKDKEEGKEQSVQHLKPGVTVFVEGYISRGGYRLYCAGRILSLRDGQAKIHFNDGDEAEVAIYRIVMICRDDISISVDSLRASLFFADPTED